MRQRKFRERNKYQLETIVEEVTEEVNVLEVTEVKESLNNGTVCCKTVTHAIMKTVLVSPTNVLRHIGEKTWDLKNESSDLAVPLLDETSAVTVPVLYLTPMRDHKKSIHQRANQLRSSKDMPRDKHMRAHVLVKTLLFYDNRCESTGPLLRRYFLDDARAKNMLASWLDQVHVEERQLAKNVRQLAILRSKKKHDKVGELFTKMRAKNSLRRISRVTNITYSHLYWMGNTQKKELLEKPVVKINQRKHVTQEEKDDAVAFFEQSNTTMQLPFKRTAHFRYMRTSMADAHQAYTRHQRSLGKRVLSITAVNRWLPKYIKPMKKVPYKQCLCSMCLNFKLKSAGLKSRRVKGISSSPTQNIMYSLCDPEVRRITSRLTFSFNKKEQLEREIAEKLQFKIKSRVGKKDVTHVPTVSHGEVSLDDCARDCIYRDCLKCGKKKLMNYILDKNPGLNMNDPASYHSWEKVTRRKPDGSVWKNSNGTDKKEPVKIYHVTEIGVLLDKWCDEALSMSTHIFNFKWQAAQFEVVKSKLMHGDVLMVMDFAQNVVLQETEEPIDKFRTRQSSTLHPIVCYYKCPGCTSIITDELLMVTPDLRHDAVAVETFTKKAVDMLKAKQITVNRIIQFTDNCAVQYKCKAAFDYMSRWDTPIHRNFFGAQHGKGPADGCIGRTVQQVGNASRTDEAYITTPFEFAFYCQENLTRDTTRNGKNLIEPEDRNMCQHFQRHFIYVHQIDRTLCTKAIVLPETMKVHSVRNMGKNGHLEVNQSSCFCR